MLAPGCKTCNVWCITCNVWCISWDVLRITCNVLCITGELQELLLVGSAAAAALLGVASKWLVLAMLGCCGPYGAACGEVYSRQ